MKLAMKSDRYEDMIVSDDINKILTSCSPLFRAPLELFTTLDASKKPLLHLAYYPKRIKSSDHIA